MKNEEKTKYVVNRLQTTQYRAIEIEVNTGISSRTLVNIAKGIVKNPHENTVKVLYDYFKGKRK